MLVEKPVFHKLAESAITELRRDGVDPEPDEICWLNHAASVVCSAANADLACLDLPVPCGNRLLWPLSIGARIWLESVAPWFKGLGDMEEFLVAFAMQYARNPVILMEHQHSRLKTFWRVATWAAGCSATRAELRAAIARALAPEDLDLVTISGPQPKRATRVESADYSDVISMLCHFYGQAPDYWLWRASETLCESLLRKVKNFAPSAKEAGAIDSPQFRKIATFRAILAQIKKDHQRPEGENTCQAAQK